MYIQQSCNENPYCQRVWIIACLHSKNRKLSHTKLLGQNVTKYVTTMGLIANSTLSKGLKPQPSEYDLIMLLECPIEGPRKIIFQIMCYKLKKVYRICWHWLTATHLQSNPIWSNLRFDKDVDFFVHFIVTN